MKLHEHQGKELLRKYGVSVPAGHVAFKLEEANKAIDAMTSKVIVVKAQIHAGGRGKGGGVKVAKTKEMQSNMQKIFWV